MKKTYLILGIAILLIIVIAATLFITFRHYVNPILINKYPALSQNAYLGRAVSVQGRTIDPFQNGTLTVNGNELTRGDSFDSFYCNGKKRKLITYESINTGQIGGWGRLYVIDCDDYYWIYGSGDANPSAVYGPFLFNESAENIEQKSQSYYNCVEKVKNETIKKAMIYGPAKDAPVGANRTDANKNTWTKQSDGFWKIVNINGEEYFVNGTSVFPGNSRYKGVGWSDDLIDKLPGGINYKPSEINTGVCDT